MRTRRAELRRREAIIIARDDGLEQRPSLIEEHQVTEDLTEYRIRMGGEWAGMGARPTGSWMTPGPAAQETFFIEHYWGYTRLSETQTSEYEVTHPACRVRSAELERFDLDVAKLYGPEWADLLSRPPDSVVLAEGSEIAVHPGRKL